MVKRFEQFINEGSKPNTDWILQVLQDTLNELVKSRKIMVDVMFTMSTLRYHTVDFGVAGLANEDSMELVEYDCRLSVLGEQHQRTSFQDMLDMHELGFTETISVAINVSLIDEVGPCKPFRIDTELNESGIKKMFNLIEEQANTYAAEKHVDDQAVKDDRKRIDRKYRGI